jgi:hypothetical protein
MTKKDFIALADHLRNTNVQFSPDHLKVLADFCKTQNPDFKRDRWFAYINGEVGPNGGKIK